MTTEAKVPRECGCLGVGRHRNSCSLSGYVPPVVADGGSIAPMEQQAVPTDVGPPVPAWPPQSTATEQGTTVATDVWHGPREGAALAATPPGPMPPPQFVQTEPPPIAPPVQTFYGLPVMTDDWMEQYGGDLAAHESYSERSRRPMATVRSTISPSRAQPDLNYKGMLVNRHAPEKRFHFAYNIEDGSHNYQQAVATLRQRGYRPVTVADFYVHSSLRDGVFIPDDGTATGRLTLGGALKGGMTVIYAQDEQSYKQWRSYDRRFSDQIQMTADEQAARVQENLAQDGFHGVIATSSFE